MNVAIIDAFISMRKFLQGNSDLFQKFQQVDQKLAVHDANFEKVFKTIENRQLLPKQGIFFDGQVFDAFKFISDLVKQAKERIVLIDNYVDKDTLTLFSNKLGKVRCCIYTKNVSKKLLLVASKFNE